MLAILADPAALADQLDEETLQTVNLACTGVSAFLLVQAGLWAILALFAFLHIFLPNKKVGMWYVKLLCWLPCFLFFIAAAAGARRRAELCRTARRCFLARVRRHDVYLRHLPVGAVAHLHLLVPPHQKAHQALHGRASCAQGIILNPYPRALPARGFSWAKSGGKIAAAFCIRCTVIPAFRPCSARPKCGCAGERPFAPRPCPG